MVDGEACISYNDTMKPKETLARFDTFLAKRGLALEAIVVGGAALGLLDVISRETRDCDILHPKLSHGFPSPLLRRSSSCVSLARLTSGCLTSEPRLSRRRRSGFSP